MGCAKPNEEFFSKEQILSICSNEKEKAISPETEVNLSKGNKGTSIALSLSFSSNFIKERFCQILIRVVPIMGGNPKFRAIKRNKICAWIPVDRVVPTIATIYLCIYGQKTSIVAKFLDHAFRDKAITKIRNNYYIKLCRVFFKPETNIFIDMLGVEFIVIKINFK